MVYRKRGIGLAGFVVFSRDFLSFSGSSRGTYRTGGGRGEKKTSGGILAARWRAKKMEIFSCFNFAVRRISAQRIGKQAENMNRKNYEKIWLTGGAPPCILGGEKREKTMSPSIHREDKSQVSVWMTPEERRMLEEVVRRNHDGNMSEAIKRMLAEEHKRTMEKAKKNESK